MLHATDTGHATETDRTTTADTGYTTHSGDEVAAWQSLPVRPRQFPPYEPPHVLFWQRRDWGPEDWLVHGWRKEVAFDDWRLAARLDLLCDRCNRRVGFRVMGREVHDQRAANQEESQSLSPPHHHHPTVVR